MLDSVLGQLPPNTRYATKLLLEQLDQTERNIQAIEAQMKELFKQTDQHKLIQTIPGIGFILAVVILQEIGDIGRFSSPSALNLVLGGILGVIVLAVLFDLFYVALSRLTTSRGLR